jgi:tetratricopeptide (TPR) repeat protein
MVMRDKSYNQEGAMRGFRSSLSKVFGREDKAGARTSAEPGLPMLTSSLTPRDAAMLADSLHSEGQRLVEQGSHEQALACYDRALAIDPKIAGVWKSKGNCLFALRRHEEAIACYDQALALDPQSGEGWHNKGRCLAALGRCDEAITCYEQALALGSGNSAAWHGKGFCLAAQEHHDEAIACYDQALALNPENSASRGLDAMKRLCIVRDFARKMWPCGAVDNNRDFL